jgi:hypothetical protein
VAEERQRQDDRWGEQNHPVHDHSDPTGIYFLGRTYDWFEAEAKHRFSRGERSWALIQLEEVFEALSARTPEQAREEFIQVAAVAVAAVEAIDRDEAKKHGPGCELGMFHGGPCGPSAVAQTLRSLDLDEIPDTFKRGGLPTVPDRPRLADLVTRELPPVISLRHPYAGEGRLHGICRCGGGRDDWRHQCPNCDHDFHTEPCSVLVGSGAIPRQMCGCPDAH